MNKKMNDGALLAAVLEPQPEAAPAPEPSSSESSPPWYSSGEAAGGSSDSRSSPCSTVWPTSSVDAIAVGFQPPRGSIGCTHGGWSST
mgnify:CR=1 FL=1